MKIGDLFENREANIYPSIEEMHRREIAAARTQYPNATSDLEALVFVLSNQRHRLMVAREHNSMHPDSPYKTECPVCGGNL